MRFLNEIAMVKILIQKMVQITIASPDVKTAKFAGQHPPPESDSHTTPQFAGKQVQTIRPNEPSR